MAVFRLRNVVRFAADDCSLTCADSMTIADCDNQVRDMGGALLGESTCLSGNFIWSGEIRTTCARKGRT